MKAIDPKQARLFLGLSQVDMARAMGVHRSTWLKWERQTQGITAAPMRLVNVLLWLKANGLLDRYCDFFKRDNEQKAG
jgi:transcriptional regulator with XRE-family HTH domain